MAKNLISEESKRTLNERYNQRIKTTYGAKSKVDANWFLDHYTNKSQFKAYICPESRSQKCLLAAKDCKLAHNKGELQLVREVFKDIDGFIATSYNQIVTMLESLRKSPSEQPVFPLFGGDINSQVLKHLPLDDLLVYRSVSKSFCRELYKASECPEVQLKLLQVVTSNEIFFAAKQGPSNERKLTIFEKGETLPKRWTEGSSYKDTIEVVPFLVKVHQHIHTKKSVALFRFIVLSAISIDHTEDYVHYDGACDPNTYGNSCYLVHFPGGRTLEVLNNYWCA